MTLQQASATLLCAALLLGCAGEETAAIAPTPPSLPPGDALPTEIDAMLYGSAQTCRTNNECPGAVGYYGACIGLLVVDQRWMQESIVERVVESVSDHEELRERVIMHLDRVLKRPDTDLAFRARALLPLEALGAQESLNRALKDPEERLQAAAALALTRSGSPKALTLVGALSEDKQPAVAAEALRALGKSRLPDALVPLLRTLNADLDASLLRAALGGLALHGDLRAMKPLRAWVDRAPEYLHHEILATMRAISGAKVGNDLDAWDRWLEQHAPPDPPAYTTRVFLADDELGLPTP